MPDAAECPNCCRLAAELDAVKPRLAAVED
jgi:hypothetical protein